MSFLVLDFCDQIAKVFQLHPDVTSDMKGAVLILASTLWKTIRCRKKKKTQE